jgi:hypothetical protein
MKVIISVEVIVSKTEFCIIQDLEMMMVDGKVCNITTDANRKILYVSVASSKHVDYLEVSSISLDPFCTRCGLSILHVFNL